MDEHVEYDGLVYKDTAVDVLYDHVENRLAGLDHQVDNKADLIIAVAKNEIKLMEQLKVKAEELKECTRYDAEHMMNVIKDGTWDSLTTNQQLLLQLIASTEALCRERAETQRIVGKCSILNTVAEDYEYDYGEVE